jgi:hypothetical protein
MEKLLLGVQIAERVLQCAASQKRIIVRIGAPQPTEYGDFLTPYQIVGTGDEKVRAAGGLDAVQSLQLVFRMIGADLAALREAGDFRWADAEDCGFPLPGQDSA